MKVSKRIVLNTLQIAAVREAEGDTYEVCATAVAEHDEADRELVVQLDAFVRRVDLRGKDQVFRPAWLPKSECVRSHVDLGEASDDAKEIFKTWTAKVRRKIPAPDSFTQDLLDSADAAAQP